MNKKSNKNLLWNNLFRKWNSCGQSEKKKWRKIELSRIQRMIVRGKRLCQPKKSQLRLRKKLYRLMRLNTTPQIRTKREKKSPLLRMMDFSK